ncbi:MAG: YbjQ family protein [DPANN group archaeon]|nr:YbjQ family protein [DPANN group archaeon]
MIIVTTDFIEGYKITKTLGVVVGNTVRAKNIGKDIMAGLKNIVGGELNEYTSMLSDARDESMNRMINKATDLDADAIINIRFMTSAITGGAAELMSYGTAVKITKK